MSDKPSDGWGEVTVSKRLPSRSGFWTTYRVLWVLFLVLGSLGLLLALSQWNHKKFMLVCGKSSVTVERGKYWPTGTKPVAGEAYAPIPIHLAPQCESKTFKDQNELDQAYLELVLNAIRRELVPGPPANAAATIKRLAQAEILCKGKNLPGCEDGKRFRGDLDYFQALDDLKASRAVLEKLRAQLAASSEKSSNHQSDMKNTVKRLEHLLSEFDRPGGAGPIVIPIPVPMQAPAPVAAPVPAPTPAPAVAPTPAPTPAPPKEAEPDAIPKGGVLM